MLTTNKYLTPEERARLEELLKSNLDTNPRDALMLLTALYTGLRRSELLGLKGRDFDQQTGILSVKTLKGGNDRDLPLPKTLTVRFKVIIQSPDSRIFDISTQRLFQIWAQWRPFNKKFHALRHTFAMDLWRRSKDVTLVKYALGHKSLSSTTVYMEHDDNLGRLKKALRIK